MAEPLQTLVSTFTTVNRRIKLSSQINSLIFHNEFSRLFWHVTDAGVDCPSSVRVWYVRAMIKNHSIQIDRSGTHIKHVADTGAQIKEWGCKNFHTVWNTLQLSRIWKRQSCWQNSFRYVWVSQLKIPWVWDSQSRTWHSFSSAFKSNLQHTVWAT